MMGTCRKCILAAMLILPMTGVMPGAWVATTALAQSTATKPAKSDKKKSEPKDVQPAPVVAPAPAAAPALPAPSAARAAAVPPAAAVERVEADVSTRTIAVTSGYSGAEIVVFGTVENSRQPSAESGLYDVVVIVEGSPGPLTVRKKSRVAGLWVNTQSFSFASVPSYYALASTRPVEEFVDPAMLDELAIGLDRVRMVAAGKPDTRVTSEALLDYKAAVVRLKSGQNLFLRNDYGVTFSGRSLFRSSIELPANVPVGPLTARIYLFRDGELLSRYQSRVVLAREGVERVLHEFAYGQPLIYGIFTVALSLSVGLLASALFNRRKI
jgi:uncharacterized protein (TIGR02186 family)